MNTNAIEFIQSDNFSKNGELLQKLESRLFCLLELLDGSTKRDVLNRKSKIDIASREKYLIDLLAKIENACIAMDMRMIKATPEAIEVVASAIALKVSEYVSHGYSLNASQLVNLFYAIDNNSVHAPRIKFTPHKSEQKNINNITSNKWWIGKISNYLKRNREHLKKLLGLIGKDQPYASNQALLEKKVADKKRQKYLENTEVISKKTGEKVLLASVSRTEKQKYSEIYCVLKGVDKYAFNNGMASALITITLPSEYHAISSVYIQKTTEEINGALSRKWSDCTQAFIKIQEFYFAFRVKELHIDSTPHIHALLYFNNDLRDTYQAILKKVFKVNDLSCGAVHWLDVDRNIGTCIGYVMKTLIPRTEISSVDANAIELTVSGRKMWGLRAYDYSGMPKGCMVCWREIRKLTNTKSNNKRVTRFLGKVKNNDFYEFFKAYKDGEISLLVSSKTEKPIGVEVFGDKITSNDANHEAQRRIIKLKNKISVTNYPSNVICCYESDIGVSDSCSGANDPEYVMAEKSRTWVESKICLISPIIKRLIDYGARCVSAVTRKTIDLLGF
jgi:hypothetical protein